MHRHRAERKTELTSAEGSAPNRSEYDLSASAALDAVSSCVSEANLRMEDSVSDGRIGSAISEDKVTEFLAKSAKVARMLGKMGMRISIPKIRCWYDFAIVGGKAGFVPVNIKISCLQGHVPESTHARYGFLFALLGIRIEESRHVSWPCYWDYFRSYGDRRSDKDYYFLIICKKKPSDVFYTSIKTLRSIRPSSVNLPFQVVWSDNRKRDFSRTKDEVYECLYSSMMQSMSLMQKTCDQGVSVMGRFASKAETAVRHERERAGKNKKSGKARARR